jgi:mono/diheme cytochrome c family protein
MTGKWTAVVIASLLTAGGCSAAPLSPNASPAAPAMAEQRCAGCHAINLIDASPHPQAPPLRDLYKRYPVDALRRAFVDGVHVGHPDMPTFRLSQQEVDRLLIYLESLNPCTQPSSNQGAIDRCFSPL